MASRTVKMMVRVGATAALFGAGLAAAPSGCFLEVTGLGTGGSSGPSTSSVSSTSGTGGVPGTSTSTSSSASTGTGGIASTSSSASTGTGAGCNTAADCHGSTPCAAATCTNHECGLQSTAVGSACTGQAGVCDSTGSCVTCIATPTQAGCAPSQYCYAGACASCTDAKLDGDETDVDCGGSTCPKCIQGDRCKVDGDCATSSCGGGICCSSDCSGDCQSCSLPGLTGTCMDVPWGETTSACGTSSYCNASGQCSPLGGLMPLSSPCTVANYATCVNGYCGGGACKLRPGDPCARDVECGTSLCSNNVCAMCAKGSDCRTGACYAAYGLCIQPEGSFCDANYECAGGACNNGVCSLQLADGQICATSADCTSWLCKFNGMVNVCTACTPGDCASCTAGACLAPSGTPCRADGTCDSGHCTGTPPYLTCM